MLSKTTFDVIDENKWFPRVHDHRDLDDSNLSENQKMLDTSEIPIPVLEKYETATLYYNPVTNEWFYEYGTREMTQEEIREEENESIKERLQATEDMLLMLMDMQMPM